MTAYIYILLDPDGNPFYVGKTINPQFRKYKHLEHTRKGSNYHVYNKIRKLLRENPDYDLPLEIIEETTEELVDERERHHIAKLREDGVKLTNIALGGEGGCSHESAMKAVETKRRMGILGNSTETREKIGAALRGKPKSDAHRAALSRAWKRTPEQRAATARKISETTRGNINIKKYRFVSPDGEVFITEHGLTDFCREHALSHSQISKVVKGSLPNWRGWLAQLIEGRNERPTDHQESAGHGRL